MRRIVDIEWLQFWFIDPFEEWPWVEGDRRPLMEEEVELAVTAGKTYDKSYGQVGEYMQWSREKHVMRIAHFVVDGWSDPIDVEIINEEEFELLDGYHRFAAAVYLGAKGKMKKIVVEFFGFIDDLPGDAPELTSLSDAIGKFPLG